MKRILLRLINEFPQQSMWFLIPMLKSSHIQRTKRCKNILSDKTIKEKDTLIRDFNLIIDKFTELADMNPPAKGSKTININPSLNPFIQTRKSSFIMPFQCNLQLTRTSQTQGFKFADTVVTIVSVESKVEVMQSLQKPKKVTLNGSDGKKFVMLFKSKDDLRIDLRFMEFSNVLKEFLHKDPESRHRQLSSRTYSVVPLNESAGLIGE